MTAVEARKAIVKHAEELESLGQLEVGKTLRDLAGHVGMDAFASAPKSPARIAMELADSLAKRESPSVETPAQHVAKISKAK